MIKNRHKQKKENGQTLVIVTLAMFAFLAFVALAIDGGYTWTQRRQAQTAADAGALAGATVLCNTTETDETAIENVAKAAAQNYINSNSATAALDEILVDVDAGTVEVTSHVIFNTFFAQLLGRPTIDAQAIAKASCTPAITASVLPIAWSCKAAVPDLGDVNTVSCEDVISDTITIEEFESYADETEGGRDLVEWGDPSPTNKTYLVMDSGKTGDEADTCISQGGTVNCDIYPYPEGDGQDDVFVNAGSFGWLDLNGGGGGASELSDWIENGFPDEIGTHWWIPKSAGNQVSVYHTAADKEGWPFAIPVFDFICKGDPSTSGTCDKYNDDGGDENVVHESSEGTFFFHIESFIGFGITCVDPKQGPSAGPCPIRQAFIDANAEYINGIGGEGKLKTIEGVFLSGSLPGLGDGGSGVPDYGAQVILLIK